MSPTALALAASWAVLVSAARWRHRPPRRHPTGRPLPAQAGTGRGITGTVGLAAVSVLSRFAPGAGEALVHDAPRLGRALLAGAVAAVVLPLAAPGVGALVWAVPALARRRERRGRAAAVRRQLPEVVDLLVLVAGAGSTVPLAVAAVARRAGGPIGVALTGVTSAVAGGARLGDALRTLPDTLGEEVRPLVSALVASERDGSPLTAGLERLAVELRHDRRRRAEAAARKVPVKLLFPLVACILPAFALLTVAPLLAGALAALRR